MNIKHIIGGVVALILAVFGGATGASVLGGSAYEALPKWFGNGLSAGLTEQLTVDKDGNATTTGNLSVAGVTVLSTFTQGGGITATSTTATAGTLQAADVDTENTIDFTANTGDTTLTLAASTTAMCPSVAGRTRTFFIRNATTSAATDLAIAGGTGIILKRATSTVGSLILGDTDASNYAKLEITKKANTDCVALMTLYND